MENENLKKLAKEIGGLMDEIYPTVPPMPAEYPLEDAAIVHRFYFAWNPWPKSWRRNEPGRDPVTGRSSGPKSKGGARAGCPPVPASRSPLEIVQPLAAAQGSVRTG